MNPALGKEYERFRALLVEARLGAGMTQSEVASELGQPQSYVSKYERGERRLDVIEFLKVARIIGFNPIETIYELMPDKTETRKGSKRARK
jgi:transcriptional regulator with XRE-family HTH domain